MSELVDIPMNEWSQERLKAGEKTATTRTERYGSPGDYFKECGKLYVFTHTVKVPLKVVANHFWGHEGAESRDEFIEVWEGIHYRKGFVPDWEVYLHLFQPIKEIVK